MIKFDKDEFLKPQIYSTNDEYEARCNVTKEIVDDIKQLQQENQELKKQYCERTDCSGRLRNSKKVDQLEKELEQLKEIEKEHQKMNGDLRIEIKELKDRINEAVEIIDLIKPELWNINNKMTYRLLDVKTALKGDKE